MFSVVESCITASLYLQPSIKCPLNGHTLAGMSSIGGDRCDEGVKLILFLLELFHQALNCPLCKSLALTSLPVAHQTVHNAQTGIIASWGVGDWHLKFCLWLFFLRLYTGDTVSHHQEAGTKTIITDHRCAVLMAGESQTSSWENVKRSERRAQYVRFWLLRTANTSFLSLF